jgi:hypothetical protein
MMPLVLRLRPAGYQPAWKITIVHLSLQERKICRYGFSMSEMRAEIHTLSNSHLEHHRFDG